MVLLLLGSSILVPMSQAVTGATTLPPGPRPTDVAVERVNLTALGDPNVGDNVTFNTTIRNMGDANATNVTITINATNETLSINIPLGTYHLGSDYGLPNLTGGPLGHPYILDFYWNTSELGKGVTVGQTYVINVTAINATDYSKHHKSALLNVTFYSADTWPVITEVEAAVDSVLLGKNVTINAIVKNLGSEKALNETVQLYVDFIPGVSKDPACNASVDLPDHYNGTAVPVSFEWNTSGTTLGNHTITVLAPRTGSNMTTSNISVLTTPPPVLKPDLEVLNLGLSASSALKGEPLNLSIIIKNLGNETSKAAKVTINDTIGEIAQDFDIAALAPSEEKLTNVTFNTSNLSAGVHLLTVRVDKEAANKDWNASNNLMNISLTMISKPDLLLSSVKFYQGTSSTAVTKVTQGMAVKIKVTIKNQGTNSSLNGTMLAFYFDNTSVMICNNSLNLLSAGSSNTSICAWNTTGLTLGLHKVLLVVDPGTANDDLNWTNNELSSNFTILAIVKLPDPAVTNLTVSNTTVSSGDKVSIMIVVANLGPGVATNTTLAVQFQTRMGGLAKTIDQRIIASMDPGTTKQVDLTWTVPANLTAGDYTITAIVNANMRTNEINRSNDQLSIPVKLFIRHVPTTDPVLTAIKIDPVKPLVGKNIQVTVMVQNRGDKDAKDLIVHLYVDDQDVSNKALTFLGTNGSSAQLVFNLTIKTAGVHWINATLREASIARSNYTKLIDLAEAPGSAYQTSDSLLLVLAGIMLVALVVGLVVAGGSKLNDLGMIASRNITRKKTRVTLVVLALGLSIALITSIYTSTTATNENTHNMIVKTKVNTQDMIDKAINNTQGFIDTANSNTSALINKTIRNTNDIINATNNNTQAAILSVEAQYAAEENESQRQMTMITVTNSSGMGMDATSHPINATIISNITGFDNVSGVIPLIQKTYKHNVGNATNPGGGPPGWGGPGGGGLDRFRQTTDYIVDGIPLNQTLNDKYHLLPTEIVAGTTLNETDNRSVLIHVDLQSYFNATVGDNITIENTTFVIKGIYNSSLQNTTVYMNIDAARYMLGLENGSALSLQVYAKNVSVVEQVVNNISFYHSAFRVEAYKNTPSSSTEFIKQQQAMQIQQLTSAAEKQKSQLQSAMALQVAQLQSDLASQVNQSKGQLEKQIKQYNSDQDSQIKKLDSDLVMVETIGNLIILISTITAGLIVIFMMFYTIKERTREIGVFKALGFNGRDITTHFVLEGTVLGFLGGIVGILISMLAGRIISSVLLPSSDVYVPSRPSLQVIVLVLSLTGVLGALGSLYPAWKASRKTVMEAMKNV